MPTRRPTAASKAPRATAPAWPSGYARGVATVDIVGIATDHCVRATALDAVKAGFAVRVLLDLTAGVAQETTTRALAALREAGVELTGAPVVRSA